MRSIALAALLLTLAAPALAQDDNAAPPSQAAPVTVSAPFTKVTV